MGTNCTNTFSLKSCVRSHKFSRNRGLHTGGADTREGRDRLLSSLKTSANESWVGGALGGVMKPSLRWIAPMAGVLERVETRGIGNGLTGAREY